MDPNRVGRRAYLTGVSGVFVGAAGCGEQVFGDRTSDESTQTPERDEGEATETLSPSPKDERQPPTYRIYKADGEVRAEHSRSESVEFSDTDATEVIQRAVNDEDVDSIFLSRGEYRIGPREIHLPSKTHLHGAGRTATTLKLRDGIDGERGESRTSILVVGDDVSDVTIENLEIDGNESNNRGVPPFPMSPHHHGILIHGSGPQVPEDRKPSNVLVRNVAVHDTVRSSVVLAGRDCRLEDLRLSNSATDHWLYLAGATNCTISGVDARGFARTSGIVFGTGRRRCSNTTLSDVTISDVSETPYQNDNHDGIIGRFPVMSVIFRKASGNAHGNTINGVEIDYSGADVGQTIMVFQPETTIRDVSYRGPTRHGSVLRINPSASDTTVEEFSTHVTPSEGSPGGALVTCLASGVTFRDISVTDEGTTDRPGLSVTGADGPLEGVRVVRARVAATGFALVVDGTDGPVRDLYVEALQDRNDTGTVTHGDVTFEKKEIE